MNAQLKAIEARLARIPHRALCLAGFAYVLVVAAMDFSTPVGMSFTLFYLVGIAFEGWICGKVPACVLSGLSAALIGFVEWRVLRGLVPAGAVLLWNALTRLLVFSTVGVLTAEIMRLTRNLGQLVDQRTDQWRLEAERHRETSGRLATTLQEFETQAWILQHMAEPMIATNEEGIIELTNPAAEKLTGYPETELKGRSITILSPFPKEEAAAKFQRLVTAVGESHEWFGELPIQRKEGTQCTAQVTITRIQIGERVLRVALYQDITARKAAENELRQREERLRSGLKAARMITWDYQVEAGVIHYSENLEQFIGGGRLQEYQNSLSALRQIHPQDRPALKIAFDRAAAANTTFGVEFRMRILDGSYRWLLAQGVPVCNEQGRTVRLVGAAVDITDRKEFESELRNREERLRLGLEAARMLTWELDVLTGVIRCSENLPDFVGGPGVLPFEGLTTLLERVHPEDRASITGAMERALHDPGRLDHEYRIRHLDDQYHWILSIGRAIRDASGHPLRLRGVSLDITERKHAEWLLQAQRDLAVSLSVTTDLKAGLERLLEIAIHITAIDCGGAYLFDPATKALRLASQRGLSDEFARSVAVYGPETPQANLVKQKLPIYSLHTMVVPVLDLASQREGLKAIAILPLVHEGQLLGCLNLASHIHTEIPLPSRFVIESIAAQAAGAIARIRVEAALHQTQERVRTLINAAPIALFATDCNEIIQFEDGQALRTIGVAPGSNLGRPVAGAYGSYPAVLKHIQRALAGEAFSTPVELGPFSFYIWYAPERDKDGHITGCIGVAMNITERQLLERQLLEITDREQARIGQDIHDGLCQQLVSLAFDANALQRQLAAKHWPETKAVQRLSKYLDAAITEARQLSRGLFPIRLATDGLPSALEELAEATSKRFHIACLFEMAAPVRLASQTIATHLYRIAQEAVNNAVKHSRAQRIVITLGRNASGILLKVADNGIGLAADLPPAPPAGMGLHIMDYRARRLGGELRRDSSPGLGTTISCCIPD